MDLLRILALGLALLTWSSDRAESIDLPPLTVKEKYLLDLDLESDKFHLKLMNILDGTSILVKVTDLNNRPIGVIKFSGSNTYHRGEATYYRLAKYLNVPIVPTTVIKKLKEGSKKKVLSLIENLNFTNSKYFSKFKHAITMKEKNRKSLVDLLNKPDPIEVCFKEWVVNFQYYHPLGTEQKAITHPVAKYLSWSSAQPGDAKFKLEQCSSIYVPTGCTHGNISMNQLAKDFTTILTLDALTSSVDRFPGANLHFRATSKVKARDHNKETDFGNVRLLALDNGAVFRGETNPIFDLITNKKRKSFGITRFRREHIQKLHGLRKALNETKDQNLFKYLMLDRQYKFRNKTIKPFKLFKENLRKYLAYVTEVEKKHPVGIWFK